MTRSRKTRKNTMRTIIKRYSDLVNLPTFDERLEYCRFKGFIGDETFGGHRYLNQILYHSSEWRRFRRRVILRDNGFDLGCVDVPICGSVYIHHLNPITPEDILERRQCIFDMENAISVSFQTHNAIHYGVEKPKIVTPVERYENDTCLWRRSYE